MLPCFGKPLPRKVQAMLNYDEALQVVLDRLVPLPPRRLPLAAAYGLVLAEAVAARWDLPPADNSAMDGYAFACREQKAGSVLAVTGFVPAGRPLTGIVAAGTAVRIMTGAPLPEGCDCVVPLEEVTVEAGAIRLQKDPQCGQHLRRRGEEARRGEKVLAAGTPLYSGELGLLAAIGAVEVLVHPAPRVALLSTGDELVELGATPGPGQIINSNRWLLEGRLRELGATVECLGLVGDGEGALDERLAAGLGSDVLLSSGGVSVGDRDLVQGVLQRHGFVPGFWKVAIKPGKPVLFGSVGSCAVFGLPGNPAAAAATFELFVRPALRRLAGYRDVRPPLLRAVLDGPVRGGEKRQRFLWGSLREEGGIYRFLPASRQGSGQNRALQGAQALLPVAAGAEAQETGSEVEVWLLRLPAGREM